MSKVVKEVYPNGSRYEGQMKKGKRHGKGTYIFHSGGGKYIGNWKKGLRDGMGERIFQNGDRYVGQWEKGERKGKGTMKYSNGEKYAGFWKNSKKHGRGIHSYKDGERYRGFWKDDLLHGQGFFYKNDKSCFEQIYMNGEKIYEVELMTVNEVEEEEGEGEDEESEQQQQQPPERPQNPRVGRLAFLCGQNDRNLVCCVNDANKMEERLKSFGYRCRKITNVDYKTFRRNFRRFLGEVQRNKSPQKRIFLYFSGHGYEQNGIQHMMCTGRIHVQLDVVLQSLNQIQSDIHVTAVIDSCRSDEARVWKGDRVNPPSVSNYEKSFILGFTCSSGKQSLASNNPRGLSLYTRELLRIMVDKDKPILKTLAKAGGKVNEINAKNPNGSRGQQAWVNFTALERTFDIGL